MSGSASGMRLTWWLIAGQRKAFLPLWLLWTVLLFQRGAFSAWTLWGSLLGGFLLLIALIDGRYGYIFDRMLLAMAAAGLGFGALLSTGPGTRVWLGALLGGGVLFLLRWLSRGGIGDGDVKFMVALGCWFTWEEMLLTLLFSFWTGGLAALWLLGLRRKTLRDAMPFGPFLSGSALLVFWAGEAILSWYRSFL